MDSRKNGAKREDKKESVTQEQEFVDKPFDSNYEELRQELQRTTKNTISRLDELIQVSGKKTIKKMYLELFRSVGR